MYRHIRSDVMVDNGADVDIEFGLLILRVIQRCRWSYIHLFVTFTQHVSAGNCGHHREVLQLYKKKESEVEIALCM